MVLSSVEVCMDSADWTQSFMQNSALKLPEDMMSCSRPMLERRLKPQPEQALKCPRCDSTNTKFCYYNNYNLSQPRHFCKTCRRYWTKGGALRNVPVGGGCRKNKRAKRTIDHPVSVQNEASTSTATANEVPNSSHFDQSLPGASNPMYYGGNNMSLPFTRVQQERPALANCNTSNFLGISCGTQASLEPQTSNLSPNSSTLSSLSNTLNSLKSGYPGLDFSNSSRDWNSFFEPHHQISRALPSMRDNFALFGMPVDGFDHNNVNDPGLQWRLQEQKLAPTFENGQVEDGQGSEGRAFLPFEDHTVEKSEVITSLPPSIKVEDENRLPSEWKVEAESLFAETAGDSTSYWNGGAWPDLSSYGSSVSPLI